MEQGSQEWLDIRKTKITATDAPVIMGIDPWTTTYQLWRRKLGLDAPIEENDAMRRGKELEPIARDRFSVTMGMHYEPKVVFSYKYNWMMASLDGISRDGKSIVEIKCPGEKSHESYRDGIPPNYYAQMQHQLECSDLDEGYFFSYFMDDCIMIPVKRDANYIKNMIIQEEKFFHCLFDFEPPEMTERDYNIRNDRMWSLQAQAWKDLNKKKKEIEEEMESIRKNIIESCGYSNTQGCGIKVTRIPRKGSIQYDKIPELSGIDLEPYRKSTIDTWRIVENG